VRSRKIADAREKELRLALYRIRRGRAHSGAQAVSIAAVAREAGVSAALIHNHYPAIAEAIREARGRASRAQRDAKQTRLLAVRQKNRELREEIRALQDKLSQLASINEMLLDELRTLKAKENTLNIVDHERGFRR
jgi:AcrR family transcriptional regulator